MTGRLLPATELVSAYDRAAPDYDAAWDNDLGRAEDSWVAAAIRLHGLPEPVADLGCGTGTLLRLHAVEDYAGVDLSPGMVAAAGRLHPGRTFTVGCLMDWLSGRPERSLGSVVMLYGVLNLLADPLSAFMLASRALLPGGRLVVVGRASGDRFDHENVPILPTPPHALKAWSRIAGLHVLECRMVRVANGAASRQALLVATKPPDRAEP